MYCDQIWLTPLNSIDNTSYLAGVFFVSIPGTLEPAGMPGTAKPLIFCLSDSILFTSFAGTWPSIKYPSIIPVWHDEIWGDILLTILIESTLFILQDSIENLDIGQREEAMSEFMENQNRDEDDRHRYSGLYGFDYGNLKGYDIVLNTNDKEPETVFQEILEKLEESDFRTN